MISFSDVVAEAADETIRQELFEVLANRLALSIDMAPGPIMEIDLDALDCQVAMLDHVVERCRLGTS